MAYLLLSSFPTCPPADTPSGQRRPGTPFRNDRVPVSWSIPSSVINYPRRGRGCPAPVRACPSPARLLRGLGTGPSPSQLRDPRRVSQAAGSGSRSLQSPSAGAALYYLRRVRVEEHGGANRHAVPAAQGSGPRC